MMLNFMYFNPTRIIFGKGVEEQISNYATQYGNKALLVTGRESAKKSGLFSKISNLLNEAGIEITEFSGVHSNPRISDCERGVDICKEHGCQMVIGIGGGSVLDTAKAISIGALDDGELWDFYEGKREVKKALPVISIMTIAATGSENDSISVIRNDRLQKKFGLMNENIFPKVSFLNPELTYTVSPEYTAYGGMDIISHVLESYIDGQGTPLITARYTESLIKTVMECVEKLQDNPTDYECRSYMMWASALACCDIFAAGTGGGTIAAHAIESEIGAMYDTAHGAGLAVILPALMKYRLSQYTSTTARFAEQIMKIERRGRMTDTDIALEGIEAFRKWLKKVGCPTTLKELGIKKEHLVKIAERISLNPWSPDKETALGVLETYYE